MSKFELLQQNLFDSEAYVSGNNKAWVFAQYFDEDNFIDSLQAYKKPSVIRSSDLSLIEVNVNYTTISEYAPIIAIKKLDNEYFVTWSKNLTDFNNNIQIDITNDAFKTGLLLTPDLYKEIKRIKNLTNIIIGAVGVGGVLLYKKYYGTKQK
jgi:hypothetical protein